MEQKSKMAYFQKMRESSGLSRIGEPWTDTEEVQVLSAIANGKNLIEISMELQRTVGSISSRIDHIACTMYDNNVAIGDISRITSLTEAAIKEALEKRVNKNKIPKKTIPANTVYDVTKTDFMEMKCLMYEIRDLLKTIASR